MPTRPTRHSWVAREAAASIACWFLGKANNISHIQIFTIVLEGQGPPLRRSSKPETETTAPIRPRAREIWLCRARLICRELSTYGNTHAKQTIQNYADRVRSTQPASATMSRPATSYPSLSQVFRPFYLLFIVALASQRIIDFGVIYSLIDAGLAIRGQRILHFHGTPKIIRFRARAWRRPARSCGSAPAIQRGARRTRNLFRTRPG